MCTGADHYFRSSKPHSGKLRLFVRSTSGDLPPPHLLSALTVGVCKGQGDTERVEGGRAEMDTAGASKGYTNEVIIIYYSYNK